MPSVPNCTQPLVAVSTVGRWRSQSTMSGVCDEESRRLAAWGEGEDEAAKPKMPSQLPVRKISKSRKRALLGLGHLGPEHAPGSSNPQH